MDALEFSYEVQERDGVCVVPTCWEKGHVHQIINGDLWGPNDMRPGGYTPANGVILCGKHRRQAEAGIICTQALRKWADLNAVLPGHLDPAYVYDRHAVEQGRRRHWMGYKLPTVGYLSVSPVFEEKTPAVMLEKIINTPLVVTAQTRGIGLVFGKHSHTLRKWNGEDAIHYAAFTKFHNSIRDSLPDNLLVYGRWSPIKPTISYKGDELEAHPFAVYALYDMDESLWLGWSEVAVFARDNGLVTVPVAGHFAEFAQKWELGHNITMLAEHVIALGHDCVEVRTMYPFPNSRFSECIAKFSRRWVAGETVADAQVSEAKTLMEVLV